MLEKKKKYLLFVLKITILIVSCYLIYSNLSSEENFFYVFKQIDKTDFLIILLITIILNHIQIFVQFKSFLRRKMKNISFTNFSKIFFNSQMISFILPHSGIIYKTYRLKSYDLSYTDFIGINLFLTWFYLFFFLIFYSFEILIFGEEILGNYNITIFIIGILTSILLFSLPFIYERFLKINFKNEFLLKNFNSINYVLVFPVTFLNLKFFKFLSFAGLVGHSLSFLLIYLLFNSIDTNFNITLIIIFFVINSFLDQVPITHNDL